LRSDVVGHDALAIVDVRRIPRHHHILVIFGGEEVADAAIVVQNDVFDLAVVVGTLETDVRPDELADPSDLRGCAARCRRRLRFLNHVLADRDARSDECAAESQTEFPQHRITSEVIECGPGHSPRSLPDWQGNIDTKRSSMNDYKGIKNRFHAE